MAVDAIALPDIIMFPDITEFPDMYGCPAIMPLPDTYIEGGALSRAPVPDEVGTESKPAAADMP